MPNKNSKSNKRTIIISVTIIAILLISSLVFVIFFIMQEEETDILKPVKEIDDRISPLNPLAIYVEMHRIRRKGIIDVMENSGSKSIVDRLRPDDIKIDNTKEHQKLKLLSILDSLRPAKGWDWKPSFNYVVTLDGYEHRGRQSFNKWDTGYINQQFFRSAYEENTTTEIEIKIVEKEQVKRLLGSSVVEKEMDCFKITYDFRKGNWEGDDFLNDTDGYGHLDGKNYEIWFSLYQTADDMDIIPYWTEVNVLGTDPLVDDSRLDPDEDGVPTSWEWKYGYDPFVWEDHGFLDPDEDGLQNVEEYYMRKWLADPFHPEIYLEVDYMAQTPKKPFYWISKSKNSGWDGWKHVFWEESQQMLIERFNEHGISVHIDDGRMGGGGDILPFGRGNGAYEQDVGVVAGFYANNFDDERKGIFRYAVIAYGGGWCHPQDYNHFYDCICVPHNYIFFKNQLGYAINDRTYRIGQAVQMLHELGHSLGMLYNHSDGVDNSIGRAENPQEYPYYDYVSVMNYDYFWLRYFDYSNGEYGEYDTDDWELIDLTFFQRPSDEMEGLGYL